MIMSTWFKSVCSRLAKWIYEELSYKFATYVKINIH